jgi:hypothetical protein
MGLFGALFFFVFFVGFVAGKNPGPRLRGDERKIAATDGSIVLVAGIGGIESMATVVVSG